MQQQSQAAGAEQGGDSTPGSCLPLAGSRVEAAAPQAERLRGWVSPVASPLLSHGLSTADTAHTARTDLSWLAFQLCSPRWPPGHLRPRGGSGRSSTRSCSCRERSLGVTKQPPEEANDLFKKLVYKPHEQLSLPNRLRCCFWSCLSEAEAPSITSSRRWHGLASGHAARARTPTPAHALGQASEGTVQKQSILVSRQRTLVACGKLLAFIFWVLGLGRVLKLWSKNRCLCNSIYGKLCTSVVRSDG